MKWLNTGYKKEFAVVKTDSTSLCTGGVEITLTTQRNGFGFNCNSRMKLNNQARCGTNKICLFGCQATNSSSDAISVLFPEVNLYDRILVYFKPKL